jgi:hypothetical protein
MKWDNDKKMIGKKTKCHPNELVEVLPKILAKLEYTATHLERVGKQLAELTDANKDALVKSSESKYHTPSPVRKNRQISNASMCPSDGVASKEAEEEAAQESVQKVAVEREKPNAFDVMRQSSKRHNFYNVDSLAQVTIDQIIKDVYQFHLHENSSFSFSSKDNAKNISMIRLVVGFSIHFTKESLENAGALITQVSVPMPESDSTNFFAWNKNRDIAVVKYVSIPCKRCLKLKSM